MDQWIRYGLIVAWLAFGIAILLWWRRRYSSRRYSYSERAATIHSAIKQTSDLGLIYWSKTEKRFLRRVVTPLELDGYSMKAFDHTANDVRIFKVTRIKTVEIVGRGSTKAPSLYAISGWTWALGGLGVAALAFLAIALYRGGHGTTDDVSSLPPPSPSVLPSAVSTSQPTSIAATTNAAPATAPQAPTNVVESTVASIANDPLFDIPKTPNPPTNSTKPPSRDRWEVIILDASAYDTNHIASMVKQLLGCSQFEAEDYMRQVRAHGQAKIWEGKWTKAEALRQSLEADDVIVKLQLAVDGKLPEPVVPK